MKRRFFVYVLVVSAAVLVVAGLIHLGGALLPSQGLQPVPTGGQSSDALGQMLDNVQHPLARLLLQLIVIVIAARAFGALAARLGVPSHAFALFCGIAMSITASPVLARILEERHLTHTPLGTTAITCAAVDDVTAWSILAFVVAVTTAGGAVETLLVIVALSV